MGFCSRCGEPCSATTCHCGGQAKTPAGHKVLYSGRAATPDGTDRWSRQYISKSPATTPKTASRALPQDWPDNTTVRDETWQAKRAKHLSLPVFGTSGGLDWRQLGNTTLSRDSNVNEDNRVAQDVEETISRAFGSVLDPVSKRRKWSCHDCSTNFVRDQTVYPDPRANTDPSLENVLYCPKCFSDRFSLGDCIACGGSVLPDAASPFVQRKDKLWHAACYACLYCSADLSKSPQVDLYGNPCCATCFDNAAFLKNPNAKTVPALLSADKESSHTQVAKSKAEQRKLLITPMAAKMGPAVRELRTRIEGGPDPVHETVSTPGFGRPIETFGRGPPMNSTVAKSPNLAMSTKPVTATATAAAQSASPRSAVTSPRIAASKAFFDGITSGLAPKTSPLLAQTPVWRGHKASQSLPVLPMSTLRTSTSQLALKFSDAESNIGDVQARIGLKKATNKNLPSSQVENVPEQVKPPRAPRPLPLPTEASQKPAVLSDSTADLFVKEAPRNIVPTSSSSKSAHIAISRTNEEAANKAPSVTHSESPSKISAGILQRSKSFRQPAPPATGLSQNTAHKADQASAADHQPRSADELSKVSRPVHQRSQSGLTRSNATMKGKVTSPQVSQGPHFSHGGAHDSRQQQSTALQSSISIDPDARCGGCKVRLFRAGGQRDPSGTKIIAVPGTGEQYHAKCFTCTECKLVLEDGRFVLLDGGAKVHEGCAPLLPTATFRCPADETRATMPEPSHTLSAQRSNQVLKPSRSATRLQQQYTSAAQVSPMSPSKLQPKPRASLCATPKLSKASEIFASREKALSSPVFGGMYVCAGCGLEGSLAETTLGPVGTRFHHACLRCVCGKQLDSGAKSYEEQSENGNFERKFACRTCIDKKSLAKRSQEHLNVTSTALRY